MKTFGKNRRERASGGLYLGKVEFSGYGGFQEEFISELLEREITLRRVRIAEGRVSGIISPMNYGYAARAARRHGVRLKAGKRSGLYFTALRYSRRGGLYIGFLLFCLILSIGQATVADIRIKGNAPEAEVIRILEECGITRGVPTHGLELSRAERKLLLEIDNASWVDVSVVGSRVTVDIEEGVPKPDIVDANQPCNIISSRDAQVVDTVVRKGKLITAIGSGVQRGGLLVSGTVADGGEHLLYQHASAEIIGEFSETREFFVPYNETIRYADGEVTEYKYLVFCEDVYPLFFGNAYVEDSLYTEQTEIIDFLGADSPFRIKTGRFTRYTERNIIRCDDDCITALKRMKADFEDNFYSEYEIVSAVERCLPEKDGIRLAVDYTLRGNIAVEVPIEVTLDSGQEEQQDE